MFCVTPFLRRFRRLALVASIPTALLLSGCWLDGNQSTFDTKGPVARSQLEVFHVTWYVTLAIFVLVGLVLAFATLRFRVRHNADKSAEPPVQGHGNPLVEFGLILASVACLAVIAVPTLRAIWFTYDVPAAEQANALVVTATGNQWWFKFEYPTIPAAGGGGAQTPLVTGNELVIPAGRAVRVNLRTADVMHSFWVPKLAGKVDMVPNRGNHIWLKADEPGYHFGQCAEFCGESHAVMRFRVIALAPADFDAWVARQTQTAGAANAIGMTTREGADRRAVRSPGGPGGPALPPEPGVAPATRTKFTGAAGTTYGEFDGDLFAYWRRQQESAAPADAALLARGRQLFTTKTCVGCHTVRGHEGVGVTAPDLTHFASRTTIAAGLVDNTDANLRVWLTRPLAVKPGNKMAKGFVDNHVTLDSAETDALVTYLRSLN